MPLHARRLRLSANEALLSPFVGSTSSLWLSPLTSLSRFQKTATTAVAQSQLLKTLTESATGQDK